MTIHHFVVMYDTTTQQWEWDTENEDRLFTEGTVYDPDTNTWYRSYLGDGIYINDDDELGEDLYQAIRILNSNTEGETNA